MDNPYNVFVNQLYFICRSGVEENYSEEDALLESIKALRRDFVKEKSKKYKSQKLGSQTRCLATQPYSLDSCKTESNISPICFDIQPESTSPLDVSSESFASVNDTLMSPKASTSQALVLSSPEQDRNLNYHKSKDPALQLFQARCNAKKIIINIYYI